MSAAQNYQANARNLVGGDTEDHLQALVYATLALAEEQRTANLLTLATAPPSTWKETGLLQELADRLDISQFIPED